MATKTNTELSHLPLAERIRRYRELALDSRRLAHSVTTAERQQLLLVADQWESLAADGEHHLERWNNWMTD
jgi:hypothetical protein